MIYRWPTFGSAFFEVKVQSTLFRNYVIIDGRLRDRSFITSQGGGGAGFFWGVQFLKRVNLGGSVLKN